MSDSFPSPSGLEPPTPEQIADLKAYAKARGKDWKNDLVYSWLSGGQHSARLQALRNTHGPEWLFKMKLEDL